MKAGTRLCRVCQIAGFDRRDLHSGFCHFRAAHPEGSKLPVAPVLCLACTIKRVRRVFSGARVVEHVELRKGRRATKA